MESGEVDSVSGWVVNFFPYILVDEKKVKNEKMWTLDRIY